MAFNSNVGRQSFTSSGGQTDFDFNFKIYDEEDIKVYLTPVGQDPDDTTDILTYGSDYTVSIDGDDGGTITLVSGATLDDTLVLARDLDKTRDVSYVKNGDLKAATLNEDQDYQTYLIIDGFRSLERALVLPTTDVTMGTELPSTQQGQYLRVKSDGTGFEYVDLDTEVSESQAAAAASAASALESAGYASNSANSAVSSANSAVESAGYATQSFNSKEEAAASAAYVAANISGITIEFLTDQSAYDMGYVADGFNLFPTDLGGLT